jgi:tellurite resistance protein TerC
MEVSSTTWWITLSALALVFLLDAVIMGRRPRVVGMREATLSVLFYVILSALFGVGVWLVAGSRYGMEYFAGYITELSLSVDNLFVFVVILSTLRCPETSSFVCCSSASSARWCCGSSSSLSGLPR